MNPKMGRPKADNPKSTQLSVKVDKETLQKLDVVAEYFGETRVQVMRHGIEKLYAEIKK